MFYKIQVSARSCCSLKVYKVHSPPAFCRVCRSFGLHLFTFSPKCNNFPLFEHILVELTIFVLQDFVFLLDFVGVCEQRDVILDCLYCPLLLSCLPTILSINKYKNVCVLVKKICYVLGIA